MRKVICIDDDFTEFKRIMGERYNFPKSGETYEVRTDNGRGGITLAGLNNPYWLISMNPLLFEEIHFHKDRFVYLSDVTEDNPYLIHAN